MMRRPTVKFVIPALCIPALLFAVYTTTRPYAVMQKRANDQHRELKQSWEVVREIQRVVSQLPPPIETAPLGAARIRSTEIEESLTAVSSYSHDNLWLHDVVTFSSVAIEKSQLEEYNRRLNDPFLRQTAHDFNTALEESRRLLAYRRSTSSALVNFREYDPAQDFENFQPDSADTKKRLGRAEEGLRKTLDRLRSAQGGWDDPGLESTIQTISSLLEEKGHLQQTGNVERWIVAVRDAQTSVAKNREDFWVRASSDLLTRLFAIEQRLDRLVRSWDPLVN